MFVRVLAIVLILMLCTVCVAGTKTWVGTTSSSWNTGTNWSPTGVPQAGDDVIHDGGSNGSPMVLDRDEDGYTIASFCAEPGDGRGLTIAEGLSLTVDGDMEASSVEGESYVLTLESQANVLVGDGTGASPRIKGISVVLEEGTGETLTTLTIPHLINPSGLEGEETVTWTIGRTPWPT